MTRVLVTGGAGYVGSVLVPKLLGHGFDVTVLDLFLYGEQVLDEVRHHPGLSMVRGDVRDLKAVDRALADCESVIHLACISNDPSFELDPALGKSINYDAFRPLVEAARGKGVRRFVYASSSSVYGVKPEERVTEDLPVAPLTDYSRFKAMCEDVLLEYQSRGFCCVILRPATVCGFSPRLRLDLTVNILTNHALSNHRIRVFGGSQYRPNLHIQDMTDCYVQMLQLPDEAVAGRIWNVGYENLSVRQIADQVCEALNENIEVVTEPTDDLRSYRIDSERIYHDIGFRPRASVHDAVRDLAGAFRQGQVPDSMTDPRYFNIKTMQRVSLK